MSVAEDHATTTPEIELPETQPEGLHFGLDETAYHSDISLGSGSIRELATNPIYYWRDSWMNPLREEPSETPALLYGRALHCLVLEGPAAFSARYAPMLVSEDYPDVCITADDIKERLRVIDPAVRKDLGIKLSGSKDELIESIKKVDASVVIWDELCAAYRDECADTGVTILPEIMHSEVIQAAAYILSEPTVASAFKGGAAEVSLFWTQDGVPMKARLDKLRLGKGSKPGTYTGLIVDLKSFTNTMNIAPERAVERSLMNTRLDIQAAAYMKGIVQIPQWIRDGKVYGAEHVGDDFLDALSKVDNWEWYWCFYEKGLPLSMLRKTSATSPLVQMADLWLNRALQAYRDNMQAFGTEWRFVDPMADKEIHLDSLPKYFGTE